MPRTWLFAQGLDLFSQLSGSSVAKNRLDNKGGEDARGEAPRSNGILQPAQMIAVGQDSVRVLWAGWNDTLRTDFLLLFD